MARTIASRGGGGVVVEITMVDGLIREDEGGKGYYCVSDGGKEGGVRR